MDVKAAKKTLAGLSHELAKTHLMQEHLDQLHPHLEQLHKEKADGLRPHMTYRGSALEGQYLDELNEAHLAHALGVQG
jgi:hypothetical protein